MKCLGINFNVWAVLCSGCIMNLASKAAMGLASGQICASNSPLFCLKPPSQAQMLPGEFFWLVTFYFIVSHWHWTLGGQRDERAQGFILLNANICSISISGKTCVDMLNDDCHFFNVLKNKTVFGGLELNYVNHLLKIPHFIFISQSM